MRSYLSLALLISASADRSLSAARSKLIKYVAKVSIFISIHKYKLVDLALLWALLRKFNLTTIGDGYTKNSVAVQNGDTDLDFSDLPFKALAIIKATLDQDVGDVAAPNLTGARDCELPQQIWINAGAVGASC